MRELAVGMAHKKYKPLHTCVWVWLWSIEINDC